MAVVKSVIWRYSVAFVALVVIVVTCKYPCICTEIPRFRALLA